MVDSYTDTIDDTKKTKTKLKMNTNLSILAGKKAYSIIKDEGLSLDRVKVLAGASGAAKYLVLTAIDRVLFSLLSNRKTPLYLIGTSIGAFRMAAFCHPQPIDAYARLEYEYIHQHYAKKPTAHEVTKKSGAILDSYIEDNAIEPILNHPVMRLSFLANRCKGLLAFHNHYMQGVGLLLAALTNAVNRDALGWYFERALFHATNDLPPFASMNQFPIQKHRLNKSNFKKALLASGSIPIVMNGVDDIKGAKGMHRDGGIIDYHLDLPFLPQDDDSLVLYPHFYQHITPGWFDKHLKRNPASSNLDNVILISPNKEFVNQLPHQKIPDRTDFKTFAQNDKERINYWQKTVDLSKCLGDELAELIESGIIKQRVKPIHL
jgi:hypothetical protein